MLVTLVVLFLATSHGSILQRVADPNERPNVRIINGDKAPDGVALYQVRLQRGSEFFFSGSILNDHWIITSGVPMRGCKNNRDNAIIMLGNHTAKAVAGTHKLNEGGVEYLVEKVIPHPECDMNGFKNDIGLVKVAKKIEFTDKIQPIALPTKNTEAGANLMVTGWGSTSVDDIFELSDDLTMLNLTALSLEECQKRIAEAEHPPLPPILPMHLCAYKDENHAVCYGDAGDALVEGNTLVGVVSFGEPCAKGFPDVYSRVFSHLDWIKETMKVN